MQPADAPRGRHRAGRSRPPVALLLAALALVVIGAASLVGGGVLVVGSTATGASGTPEAPERPREAAGAERGTARPGAAGVSPASVLREWDAARSAAYAAGDVDALRSLHTLGGGTGPADVAVLEAYAARGLVVDDLRFEVVGLEVVEVDEDLLVLRVEDRMTRARVLDGAGREVGLLPERGRATRELTFERDGGRWRLGAAQEERRDSG
ncbi:hypothetical protein RDV89_06030 [Nocardioides zeae]|uniref:Nuclear transport factor 2 family protein n=1 Tax=Nocardioides imazamoxiresistens TaxID=3231893 RepID=A0ABU3PTP6_9ACTN|nr:hypothetical protein [Nocardioides zeae]MDT9592614.1 hypothetical protein [Nocardioides zeae]